MFDFNKDGKKDTFEKAAELTTHIQIMKKLKKDNMERALSNAGLNLSDLEMMDNEERVATLESAGLNPHDFDFN